MGGFAWSEQLSERGPKFQVAVQACAAGGFTFEIFTVSGEPRTLEFASLNYASPVDAARAGYEAMAAKGLQIPDTSESRPATAGRRADPSPNGESVKLELGVLIPLVVVMNVVVAIVAWYAVGGLLG
jgi:hypothetical protein